MIIMLAAPQSGLEWVLFLAIASSAICMAALAAMVIVQKGLAAGTDWAIHSHSVIVAALIVLTAIGCWVTAFATWML